MVYSPTFQKLKPNQRFKHNATSTTIDGADVAISEDGLVTITKEDGDEYDEIKIKAGTIFKIGNLLRATRHIITVNMNDRQDFRDKVGVGTISEEDRER